MATKPREAGSASGTARRLARGVSLYGFALFAPRVVRLVTVPLIAFAISLRDFGTYALLSLIIPIAHTACELGMGTAALRLAPEARDDARGMFSSVVYGRILLAGAMFAALTLARAPLSRLLTGGVEHASLVPWVALTVVAVTLSDAFGDQLRFDERHRTLAAVMIARTVLVNGLSAFLVVVSRWGLRGMIMGRLVADATMLVVLAWTCRATLRARPSAKKFFALLRLGAPLALLFLLVNLRELDRFLIETRGSIEDVGGYDLAMRIVGPVALGNLALGLVLEPHLFRTYADPGASAMVGVFFRAYVAVFSVIAIAAALLSPEVFHVIAPSGWGFAARAAPTLLFAFVTEGILRVAGIGADLAKRTTAWAFTAIVQLAISLSLAYLLVPRLGILGASTGLLVGMIGATIVASRLSRALHPLPLPVARALVLVALGAALGTLLLGGVSHAAAPLLVRLAAIPLFAFVAHRASGIDLRALREALRA
jgi:O-antigen/teichoic acid export membrane protein